jgi:predicted transcriptional regulator
MAKSTRIAIRVSDEMRNEIERLAKADERSMSFYIEKVLKDHIASLSLPQTTPQKAPSASKSRRST